MFYKSVGTDTCVDRRSSGAIAGSIGAYYRCLLYTSRCVSETEGTELTHVRLEPSSKIVRDKNNAEIQLAATLFLDCKYSCPAGMEIQLDDIVVFNGQKLRVQLVDPL